MKCDFSYHHYRTMLRKALEAGFVITNFRDYDKVSKKKKIIILRHDIDYTPERALKIARIDHQLGLKSTFFVRVHGEHYCPFERGTYQILQEIKKYGHEIGLHYEAKTLAKAYQISPLKLFLAEKSVLESILEVKIETAAEHADLGRKDDYWVNHLFQKVRKDQVGIRRHTYEKEFQKFYLADSCNVWSRRCLCQNLDKNHIQLLTHPDLWGKGALEEVRKKVKLIGLKPTY